MEDTNSSRREFITGQAFRSKEEEDHDAYSSAAPETLAQRRQEAYVEHFSTRAMACQFEIVFNAGQYQTAGDSAMAACELIYRLEDQLTIYREWSEVSRLNISANDDFVQVEKGLFGLLQKSQQLYEITNGAFDITSAPLSEIWGFTRREGRFPSEDELEEVRSRVGMKWIELNEQSRSVRFTREGLAINLGGIGKGYALDRVTQLLHGDGLDHFLIHGGQSSIVASGERSGIRKTGSEGWTIGLAHPIWPEKRIAEIQLKDQALGTSGTGRQAFYYQGKKYGHIIDPRSGYPADLILSSTVLAPSAAEADALATACYVLGVEETEKLCDKRPDISAILITQARQRGGVDIKTFGIEDNQWRRVDDQSKPTS